MQIKLFIYGIQTEAYGSLARFSGSPQARRHAKVKHNELFTVWFSWTTPISQGFHVCHHPKRKRVRENGEGGPCE